MGPSPYDETWAYQEKLHSTSTEAKLQHRKQQLEGEPITTHHFLLCEHPHVFTLGKSGSASHLLISDDQLSKIGATYAKINRGGDITYHGPGQIVGYPILDLDKIFTDIHKYLRYLEEVIILTLADYGIKGERYEGFTGVWIEPNTPNARKICAMGVRCSRWVTMHGFALNVNTDLSYFNYIVPCGIEGKQVTSMQKELNKTVDLKEVQARITHHFSNQFDVDLVPKPNEASSQKP